MLKVWFLFCALAALAPPSFSAEEGGRGDKRQWKIHYEAAAERWRAGDIEGAIKLYEKAIAESEPYAAKEYHLAFTLADLGALYVRAGNVSEGVARLEQAVAAAEKVKGRAVAEMVVLMQWLAGGYRLAGQLTKAEETLTEARKIIGLKFGRFSYAMRLCLDELGRVQLAQGKLDQAEKSFKESLDIASKPQRQTQFEGSAEGLRATIWERRDPFSAVEPLNGLGEVHKQRTNYAEAAKWFSRGVAEAEKSRSGYWPAPAWNLGQLQLQTGKIEAAEQTFQRALSRQGNAAAAERYVTLKGLAQCYVKANQPSKLSETAIKLGTLGLAGPGPNAFAEDFARWLAAQAPPAQAVEMFDGLVAEIEKKSGSDSPLLLPYLHQLQIALRQAGNEERSNAVNGRALGLKLKLGL